MVSESLVRLHTCPGRQDSSDESVKNKKGADFWASRGPDLICSYCASMEPGDFVDWAHRCIEPDSKVVVDIAKDSPPHSMKYYLFRVGIVNQSQGAIKCFRFHIDTDDKLENLRRHKIIGDAIEVSAGRIKRK